MGFRAVLVVGLAVLVVAGLGGRAGRAAAVGGARAERAGKVEHLVAFRSCAALLGYVRAQAARFVGPWGLGAPGALAATAPAARESGRRQGVEYSGTNVQEEGVDEPDLVKTDGETLFAVANGRLSAVDVGGRQPRLLDTLKLEAGWSQELLLYGDRLLVLSRGGFWVEPLPALAAQIAPFVPSKSIVTEVDVSVPRTLRVVRTLTLDGAYVAARLVGRSARIVAASQVPAGLRYEMPTGTSPGALEAARKHNRAVVASSGLSSWLPQYRLARPGRSASRGRPLVQCRQVNRPSAFSGLGMLTVLTIDLAKGLEPVDSVALMTDARIVYASPESLYVATEGWAERPDPLRPAQAQSGASTALHRFDISSPTRTLYRASGRVSGYLLSQWSLSEHRGVLRAVSTETPAWWEQAGESESFLTTLRQENGALVQTGRIGGLGKGERVYAVRFVGDTAYVVTFRQVDPLYTVDLADPERPQILGELKVRGYSAYLHPIGEDLLLGIGQDADEQGRLFGTQLSIFDVSDLRRPARLHTLSLGQGWSEAESDHHAFLYWPSTGLVVVPFDQRAVGFHVVRTRGIVELGRVSHPGTAPIRRSLVVGDTVLTISDAGMKASSLAALIERGWVTFPPPETPPAGKPPTP